MQAASDVACMLHARLLAQAAHTQVQVGMRGACLSVGHASVHEGGKGPLKWSHEQVFLKGLLRSPSLSHVQFALHEAATANGCFVEA